MKGRSLLWGSDMGLKSGRGGRGVGGGGGVGGIASRHHPHSAM